MKRRVVITGMGLVTPLGHSVQETFDNVIQGKNGIGYITLYDTSTSKVKIAAEVKDIDFTKYMDARDVRRQDRVTNLAMVAAKEAYEDSKIEGHIEDPYRFGNFITSGIGGLNTIYEETVVAVTKGIDRVSPFFTPKAIINLIGANVSIKYGAKGPNLPVVTACSASTNAIGEAYRQIKDGYLDVAFAGGSESAINPIGVGGFSSLRALNMSNNPDEASMPFDKRRSGFVIGEGAGVVIVEELEHAKRRGAHIYAEIVGYGTTSDAFHITAPEDTAESIIKAINTALEGINKDEVAYVNAHGTSTELNDKTETFALKQVFGNKAYDLNISSTKSMLGHSLGATGAVEAILTMKAMQNSLIPPTINYKEVDPDCDLNYTPNVAVRRDIKYALSINLGFGGQNAAITLKRYENE